MVEHCTYPSAGVAFPSQEAYPLLGASHPAGGQTLEEAEGEQLKHPQIDLGKVLGTAWVAELRQKQQLELEVVVR